MKHLLSLLLAVCLLLSLCACSAYSSGITILPSNNEGSTPVDPLPPIEEQEEAGIPDESDKDTTSEDEATSSSDDGEASTGDTQLPPEQGDESPLDGEQENDQQHSEEDEENTEDEEYIRTIDPYAPMVALTFDDGPHELYSQQILDVLEQYHAVATFFEVGYNARCYPDILRRMASLGCEIASHTNAHHDLTTLSQDAMLTDLAKLDQIIYDATGATPTLVRPPYGAVNSMVKYQSGRAMVLWTVDTKDWLYRDVQVLTDFFMNYGDLDGEIVLLHSIHASTAEAMAVVIPWLIEQGYQLVTVSELMAYYYGELFEANHFYGWSYFAQHRRTEYPLELPTEPMETDIPPFTVVPVVPTPEPQDPPPEQPPEPPSDQPPVENPETPPPDESEETPPPSDENTPPPDVPDAGENPSDEDTPPTTEPEAPTEGEPPSENDENSTT